MKVLFAVGYDQLSKNIADRYYDKFGETLEYKNVFYFKALLDEVKNNKTYNVIVINEDLEQYKVKDIEQLDRKLFTYVDSITDEVQDTDIIYICSDRRTKDDKFIVRLYSIGIYNILLGDNRNIDPLCEIIKKPKTKREAKEYLNIDSNSISETGMMSEDEVDESQMMSILNYYAKIKDQPELYVETFDRISSQYNRSQLKVIASWLPKDVQTVIYNEPKYKFLLEYSGHSRTQNVEQVQNVVEDKKIERKHSQDFFGVFKRRKDKLVKDSNDDASRAQQELAERARKEAEARQQQELAERARKEAEARQQQELAERARKEAEARQQQELAERARKEAEARQQQELAERARKEAEARQQQELAERARKEAEARQQQELAERARKEAEARQQQELAERARKEAEARQQQELAERARKEAEAKEQQELAERARKEAEAKKQQEKSNNNEIDVDVMVDTQVKKPQVESKVINVNEQVSKEATLKQQEVAENARKEAILKQQEMYKNNNVINASINTSNVSNEEQRKIKEEQDKLAAEQEKIRKAQAELEEERRKLREAKAKLENEKNQVNVVQTIPLRMEREATASVANINTKKMVVFVGANKAGTTFMTNAVAHDLSNKKIVTSILDMTRDKGMYYIYNQRDKALRKIAGECMQRLSEGEDTYMPINKYLKVYTTIPGSMADARRSYKHRAIIDTVKNSGNVTIVDADFTTPIDYFEQANEIYIIQDMDILKMQEATLFLREMKNRNMDMTKIKVVINKYVKSSLTPKRIIEGLSYYKDPEMTFMDTLLSNKVLYSTIPYNLNNYIKYIEALCKENMNFKGYTPDFVEAINEISEQIYSKNGLAKKGRGLFG